MLLLGAELIFAKLPPGAGLFFESEKRRDPSRAFMPVLAEKNNSKSQVNILEKNP